MARGAIATTIHVPMQIYQRHQCRPEPTSGVSVNARGCRVLVARAAKVPRRACRRGGAHQPYLSHAPPCGGVAACGAPRGSFKPVPFRAERNRTAHKRRIHLHGVSSAAPPVRHTATPGATRVRGRQRQQACCFRPCCAVRAITMASLAAPRKPIQTRHFECSVCHQDYPYTYWGSNPPWAKKIVYDSLDYRPSTLR